jgi:AcrR family transcriptional regulator
MTRKLSKEIRTNQIITAAASEFVKNGYENTSMESIARSAGITKGGLYHHYRGKDEILVEATRQFAEPVVEFMTAAIEISSAKEALNSCINNYLSYWYDHRTELAFYFLSMVKTTSIPHLAKVYEGYTEKIVFFYDDLFKRGISQGEFKAHNSLVRAVSLTAALDGAVGYLLIDPHVNKALFIHNLQQLFVDEILLIK